MVKSSINIIFILLLSSFNALLSQNITIKAKVIVKANNQYLKVVIKSDEKAYLNLQFLDETFNTTESKLIMKYDSTGVKYSDHHKDTINLLKYYDLPISKFFFIYDNYYIRYFIFDRTILKTDQIEFLNNLDRSINYEAPTKRKVYRIPLSINPEILKLKPKKIYCSSILYLKTYYSKKDIESISPEDIEIKEYELSTIGKIKYCFGWKKWK